MNSGKVIAFHSYKGGTGKTTCIVNLAAIYAKQGFKVCLMDLDVYAPSLSTYFNTSPDFYIHHFLQKKASINEILYDYSNLIDSKGELHIAFASPRKEDIHYLEISYAETQLKALRQFLAVKQQLLKKDQFDYIFLDTSPGIRYWSINALALADALFILLKINNMDIKGTKKMISEIYDSLIRYGLKSYLLLNKVPGALPNSTYNDDSLKMELEGIQEALGIPVFHTIPCFCDLQFNREEFLSVLNTPLHPFSLKIKEIPDLLAHSL